MNQLFGLQHRRKHHPPKALPQGRDATAPPRRSFIKVRLGIKALACFFATTRGWSQFLALANTNTMLNHLRGFAARLGTSRPQRARVVGMSVSGESAIGTGPVASCRCQVPVPLADLFEFQSYVFIA